MLFPKEIYMADENDVDVLFATLLMNFKNLNCESITLKI